MDSESVIALAELHAAACQASEWIISRFGARGTAVGRRLAAAVEAVNGCAGEPAATVRLLALAVREGADDQP